VLFSPTRKNVIPASRVSPATRLRRESFCQPPLIRRGKKQRKIPDKPEWHFQNLAVTL